MNNIKSEILDVLQDLLEAEFKLFKWQLTNGVTTDIKPIPRGKLENADRHDVVDYMVQQYSSDAGKIAVRALRNIGQNHLAAKLEEKLQEGEEKNICIAPFTEYETSGKRKRKQEDDFLENHKAKMKKIANQVFEGKKENKTQLEKVYTELLITEGHMTDVNCEHEITNIDRAFKPSVQCNDIFSLLKQKEDSNIVLTKGIAGIGKTFSVNKFILDWAEGKANQDIDCIFLLPFLEFNLRKDEKFSLHGFLQELYLEMKELKETKLYEDCKLAFIFDGLDECRLPLNFKCRMLNSVHAQSSVEALFINLVKGSLLPSALIWITSRPAAANQIPPEYVGLFTEVRGFTDEQKKEYFRKRIKDETQASQIISHVKTSPSLYIMCHIPVFCWITATVLQKVLFRNNEEEIPKTLTDMYIHFLLIQMNMKNQKYDEKAERDYSKLLASNKNIILKLAKLAFEQLKSENSMFYEEDLKECDINVSEYTGVLTEIFKEVAGLHEMKVFCFVHLSVQEFFAALHVIYCYLNKDTKELQFFFKHEKSLHGLLEDAIHTAVKSEKGHLDLFLRFLMGISLESNQNLLKGLFTHIEDSRESIKTITEHINKLQDKDINLFYCLLELKSEKVMDEFNMKMYNTSPVNYMRIVPAVRCCRKALLDLCNLTDKSCEVWSMILSSDCPLRDLDLSNNDLQDSGVKLLCDALKSPNCKLEILRLSGCMVTEKGCSYLASALRSNPSHLRELDLSYNHPGDSGVKLLYDRLNDPNCSLKILKTDPKGENFKKSGIKKHACDLTLDPNTAHVQLSLSDGNMTEECPFKSDTGITNTAELKISDPEPSELSLQCDLLLYIQSRAPLILHVYFFPLLDTRSKEEIEKNEKASYQISHPRPDMALQMETPHILEVAGASVHPKEGVTFRRNIVPNFFKVKPRLDGDVVMNLRKKDQKDQKIVWTATIERAELAKILKKDERHPNTDNDDALFFDKHWGALIQRVINVKSVADKLLQQHIIHEEQYSKITQSNSISQYSMREICDTVRKGGSTMKAKFISILREEEPHLLKDLSDST